MRVKLCENLVTSALQRKRKAPLASCPYDNANSCSLAAWFLTA